MNAIQIKPVRSPSQRRLFLTFPWRIYKDDPLWVPPLLPERTRLIDARRGPFFQRGQAEFFIAWRAGKPVGTICCGEDRKANQNQAWKDCMIGFFESIDDYSVAQTLLDHACQWAADHRLDALYGPFNLDYEDGYGVLIEGRDRPPVVLCGHTPPYYAGFFERYGFERPRGDNIAYAVDMDLTNPTLQRIGRIAERLRQRGRFLVRSADLKHWEAEIQRVYGLINRALSHLPGFTPWQPEALQADLEPFRQFVDPDLVLFAETDDGETVGWFAGVPNLNEALIHANGLRYPWDYLKLFWFMRRQPDCLAIKSVLVPPEYWDTGVAVLLFDEMAKRAAAKGYRWVDLSLTSDDNPRTPALAERVGAKVYKRYRVYRKWLSSSFNSQSPDLQLPPEFIDK
jgi:GNAT superfamily N-acetyltransferase